MNRFTGKTVLVAAHGNSLRALVKHLDDMSREGAAKQLAWQLAAYEEMKASFDYDALGQLSRSADPEGGALTYSWAFGDGTTSTATNPSKTFAAAGTYTRVFEGSTTEDIFTVNKPLTGMLHRQNRSNIYGMPVPGTGLTVAVNAPGNTSYVWSMTLGGRP